MDHIHSFLFRDSFNLLMASHNSHALQIGSAVHGHDQKGWLTVERLIIIDWLGNWDNLFNGCCIGCTNWPSEWSTKSPILFAFTAWKSGKEVEITHFMAVFMLTKRALKAHPWNRRFVNTNKLFVLSKKCHASAVNHYTIHAVELIPSFLGDSTARYPEKETIRDPLDNVVTKLDGPIELN